MSNSRQPVAYLEGNEIYFDDEGHINDYIRQNGVPLYTHPASANAQSEREANAILTERIAELEQQERAAMAAYVARPENNTKLEEVSMTKVTVEHQKKAQPSIFRKGNLVQRDDGAVVLVTRSDTSSKFFVGIELWRYGAPGTLGRREKERYKQFHGTVTLESPQ
jgi:hypothetical protein